MRLEIGKAAAQVFSVFQVLVPVLKLVASPLWG